MSSDFKPQKVTPEKFEAIKKAFAKTGMTRIQVGRKFNVGLTTLTTIRHCDVYEDYVEYMRKTKHQKQPSIVQKQEVKQTSTPTKPAATINPLTEEKIETVKHCVKNLSAVTERILDDHENRLESLFLLRWEDERRMSICEKILLILILVIAVICSLLIVLFLRK